MGKKRGVDGLAQPKQVDAPADIVRNRSTEIEKNRIVAKAHFIAAVAEFLTTDVVRKSIKLQMGEIDAQMWAQIANTIPGGSGYDTVEKRIEQLTWLLA